MRKSRRLLIEKVLLGANIVGIAIGLVLTIQ